MYNIHHSLPILKLPAIMFVRMGEGHFSGVRLFTEGAHHGVKWSEADHCCDWPEH